MADALVFGSGSFIGRHLCAELRRRGVSVVGTTRRPGCPPGTEVCDVQDAGRVAEVTAAARPRWVFQCTGATDTADPGQLYRCHVLGTLNVLAAARRTPEATVVLFGSAAEYGRVKESALPIEETRPGAPVSFFGSSKLAQTHLARAAAADWGLRVVVLRPFNVIGPGLPRHYFAAAVAERLLRARANREGGDFPVKNAAATRDFIDVRDVAGAAALLMTRGLPDRGGVEIYNVCSGEETPLLAAAGVLCSLAGDFRAVADGAAPDRSGIVRSRGSAARLRAATGWRPQIRWQESLADLWSSLTRQA